MRRRENLWRGWSAQCSLFELNETREESERESFLLKIFLGKSPRKSSFHPEKL